MKTENAWPRWLLHLWLGWWSRLSSKHRIVPSPHLLLCLTVGSLLLILLHPTLKTLIYPWQKSKAAGCYPVQIQVHFSAQSCSSVLSVASSPPLSAPISLLFSQDLSFSPWPPSLIRCELHIICRFGLGQHLRSDSPFEGTLLTGRSLPLQCFGANTAASCNCRVYNAKSQFYHRSSLKWKLGGVVWGGNISFVLLSQIS